VEDTNINRKTVQNMRNSLSAGSAAKLKRDFNPDRVLTIHWDSKIVPTLVRRSTTDRLALVVTGYTTNQLSAMTQIEKGSGKIIAESVVQAASDWDITDYVKAMSYDTTSSNTGRPKEQIILPG